MNQLLDRVEGPEDVKKLNPKELNQLAQEIRELIIQVVSKTGGHLSPNLGVVELTLALHRVFDFRKDRIIWDVGHQCYTHKIITGRKKQFLSLRQFEGLCGFPDQKESEYDVYNTGHASTALSAALGMAVAQNKKNENHHVVAVVGDGSLTGGVAWEALNQIGHMRQRMIIVLNYNEMSISHNVGALSKYLEYLVSGQHYLKIKDTAKTVLKSVPAVGWPMIKVGRAVEEAIKKVFFPGLVFKELGIKYVGPVQGHSISSLLEVFEDAKTYDGPVLIHCVTKKGKGYHPAQKDSSAFHGASPFDVETGKPLSQDKRPSFSHIFGDTAVKLAESDDKVVAITAAMPDGTGLQGWRNFPRNFPTGFLMWALPNSTP